MNIDYTFVDDIESENEHSSSEAPSPVKLRASRPNSSTQRDAQNSSPVSQRPLRPQSSRLSLQDFSFSKFPWNVRPPILDGHSRRPFKPQISNDSVNDENIQKLECIGEETQDHAIFKIYLKRIPQKTSTLLGSSNSAFHSLDDQQAIQNESSNNDGSASLDSSIKIYQLKAGTIEKIVECLTNEDGDLDTLHMHILFATYRTYTTTRILVDSILNRHREVNPASLDMSDDVRKKILKNLSIAFICLLTTYKEDFYEPPSYTLLKYLLGHAFDQDLRGQCKILLDQYINDGQNFLKSDSNNLTSKQDVDNKNSQKTLHNDELLQNQKGVDGDTIKTFLRMTPAMVAEQLTIIDAELLKRVLPHECLTLKASRNSRRGVNPDRTLSTVENTIAQFNVVVNRVLATVLNEQNEQQRARIIEKWIDIAYECHQLKNFSSSSAVTNSLLSQCIHRLETTWSHVNLNHYSNLKKLEKVSGTSTGRTETRDLHEKQLDEIRLTLPECTEGAAKSDDATNGRKRRSKKRMIGAVPYLGLYLSDLTNTDCAFENNLNIVQNDKSSEKLINFEKQRKIFKILARIKLFQTAANAYTTLHSSPSIKHWFDSVRTFGEDECWELSYRILPKEISVNTDNQQQPKSQENPSSSDRSRPLKACPSELSLELLTTSNNPTEEPSTRSSPSLDSLDNMSVTSTSSLPQSQKSIKKKEKKPHSNHSRASSASSFLTNNGSSQGYMSAQASPANSVANCTFNSVENDTLVAKVQLTGRNDLVYKTVRIGNNEQTHSVLKSILEKFGLDPSTYNQYCIEQKLPNRRIVILDRCAIYYALVRQSDNEQVDLFVREKTSQERQQTINPFRPNTGENGTSSGLSISSTHSH